MEYGIWNSCLPSHEHLFTHFSSFVTFKPRNAVNKTNLFKIIIISSIAFPKHNMQILKIDLFQTIVTNNSPVGLFFTINNFKFCMTEHSFRKSLCVLLNLFF